MDSPSPPLGGYLAVELYSPLPTFFARHIFSAFMWAAAKTMNTCIPASTDVRPTAEGNDVSGDSQGQSFTQHNAHLSKTAQDIRNTGLGTLDDIYLALIPPLSAKNKLPQAEIIIE